MAWSFRRNGLGPSLAALSALLAGALQVPACTSGESQGPQGDASTGDDGGAGDICGSAGAACCANPGETPNPECDDGDESQCAAAPSTCAIAASCGTVGTAAAPSCEPLASNTTSAQSFRMRRIILVAPPRLANISAQNAVVTSGVDMAEPQCGEEGTGDFSWLLRFDNSAKTLETGGAPPCDTTDTPACDPFKAGYCFVHKQVGQMKVIPVTAPTVTNADGTLSTQAGAIPSLNIPIYFEGSIIILPIRDGQVSEVKVSSDGNCIGHVNTQALSAACADNYQSCSKWLTDGALTGFITLDEADEVQVAILGESLCSLLTADNGGAPVTTSAGTYKTCSRDASGKIVAKGNYCAGSAAGTTKGPGGCQDSFWLAATFAASAVTINEGTGVPDCTEIAGSDDAGVDGAGPVVDAGPQVDAAPLDAGPPDAGHDAGPADSGVDAGHPDAGVDAGPPDAGEDATVGDATAD